jgi:hypothetical protein
MSLISQSDKTKLVNALADETTPCTALLAVIIDNYGTEAFDWEPATLKQQIKSDFNVELPQGNMDKIMSGITILTTNLFYVSTESFMAVANALNDDATDFYAYNPVTAAEAAWAITEAFLLDPPDKKEDPSGRFSPEVKRLLGVILIQEGLQDNPPDVLKIADVPQGLVSTAPEATFADDPVMYEGFHALSQSKSKDIVNYIKTRLTRVISALNQLPLAERDKARWKTFMERTQPR